MATNRFKNDKPRTSSTIEMEYWFDSANRERIDVGAPRHTWKLCANAPDARFVAPVFTLILGFFLYQTWAVVGWLEQRSPHDWSGVWHDFEPHRFWGTLGYLLLMGFLMRIALRDRARLKKIRTDGVLANGVITDCTLRKIHDDVQLLVCFELTPTGFPAIRGCRHMNASSGIQPDAKVTALVLKDGQYALL
jgi:hypothetical protein